VTNYLVSCGVFDKESLDSDSGLSFVMHSR